MALFFNAMDNQNLRQTIRWQVNRDALLRLDQRQDLLDCHVNDINYKGLQVCVNEELAHDKPLKFNIVLSDDYSLDIESRIVWRKRIADSNVYGIYFTRIKDRDKEKIYQFVRKFSPKELSKQWWQG